MCVCEEKAVGAVGLRFSGVVGSNGLAAFTMLRYAASNGVSECVCACMQLF